MKHNPHKTAIDYLKAQKDILLHNAMIAHIESRRESAQVGIGVTQEAMMQRTQYMDQAADLHITITDIETHLTPPTDHANPQPA